MSSNAPEQSAAAPIQGTAPPQQGEAPKVNVESRRKAAAKRIFVWLLFGAVVGLLPILAVILKEYLSPKGLHIDSVLASGDLLIVSAVLSASALGELIAASTKEFDLLVIVAGFFCLACFAGDVLAFAFADNATSSEIVTVSLWFFPATLIASSLCVGTAAYR